MAGTKQSLIPARGIIQKINCKITIILMLTNEERLIYDMLSAKIGYVPVLVSKTRRN
jgi:hypothetical protein